MTHHQTVRDNAGIVRSRSLSEKSEISRPCVFDIQVISPVVKTGYDVKQTTCHVDSSVAGHGVMLWQPCSPIKTFLTF